MCGIAGYIGKKQIVKSVIEKTLGLMKNRGPDYQDWCSFIANDTNVYLLQEEMLSDGRKITTAVESENKEKIRRSIVAKYDLESGHVLTIDDLDWVRPGGGIKPGLEDLLVGKKLKLAIKKGCKIVSDSLK